MPLTKKYHIMALEHIQTKSMERNREHCYLDMA